MKEIWKDIPNYEGLYQVSNFGNVKSLVGYDHSIKKYVKREKLLTPSIGEYKKIQLFKNKKRSTYYIHRLVAQSFIDNPNNYKIINHKDENKYNNSVDNLEWCTHKENINYGTKQERASKIQTKYHVLQYDLNDNLIRKWKNLREITLNTNYNKSYIIVCCQNKRKTAYGYKWAYLRVVDRE